MLPASAGRRTTSFTTGSRMEAAKGDEQALLGRSSAVLQRREPVAAGGRSHAEWHEVVVGFDDRGEWGRRLYEVQRS